MRIKNKIIGKTTTGKNVYDNPNHPSHKSFTASDHLEASMIHHNIAKSEMGRYRRNFDNAELHNELAIVHERIAFKLQKDGDIDMLDYIIQKS